MSEYIIDWGNRLLTNIKPPAVRPCPVKVDRVIRAAMGSKAASKPLSSQTQGMSKIESITGARGGWGRGGPARGSSIHK